jgi:probable F420-dependent oxidoreductase
VTLSEHVFTPHSAPGAYPYSADGRPPYPLGAPFPDVLVLAGAIAAATSRVTIATGIYLLPLRHPILAARAAGTVSSISGGRLSFGVGAGWLREEFETLGVAFERRGAILDESIAALRALWGPAPAEHHGRFFSFGPLYLEPRPPHIPILVGGTSSAALRRAARLGDGYVVPRLPLREIPPILRRLDEALRAEGRSREEFATVVGSTEIASAEQVVALGEFGVTAVSLRPWPAEHESGTALAEKIELLEQTAECVLAPLRS